jgi:hypothetical protein
MWLVLRERAHAISRLQFLVTAWLALGLTSVFVSGEGLWWRL